MTGDMAEYYSDEGCPTLEKSSDQLRDEAHEERLAVAEVAGWGPEDDL